MLCPRKSVKKNVPNKHEACGLQNLSCFVFFRVVVVVVIVLSLDV